MKRSGFLAFCAKLGIADSFIKSASYLMHTGGFSKVRSFLLDHSAHRSLQDDSGIPLAYFDRKKWQLQPFGHYVAPLSIFPGHYQPEMAELFRNGLPSRSTLASVIAGSTNESNLLLAEKIAPAVTEASINPSLTIPVDGAPGIMVGSPDTPAWAKMHPKFVASAAITPPPLRDAPSYLFPLALSPLTRAGQNSDKIVVEAGVTSGRGKIARTGYAAQRCLRCRAGRLSALALLLAHAISMSIRSCAIAVKRSLLPIAHSARR